MCFCFFFNKYSSHSDCVVKLSFLLVNQNATTVQALPLPSPSTPPWLTKCELTKALFDYFAITDSDSNGTGTSLRAKCLLCDPNAPEKSFKRGNNSNLKVHIMKVCKRIKHLRFWNRIINWQLSVLCSHSLWRFTIRIFPIQYFQMHGSVWNEILDRVKGINQSLHDEQIRSKKEQIENAIIKYHIKERLPLLKMESKHFNELIDGEKKKWISLSLSISALCVYCQ